MHFPRRQQHRCGDRSAIPLVKTVVESNETGELGQHHWVGDEGSDGVRQFPVVRTFTVDLPPAHAQRLRMDVRQVMNDRHAQPQTDQLMGHSAVFQLIKGKQRRHDR
jgi:hypothetical protein